MITTDAIPLDQRCLDANTFQDLVTARYAQLKETVSGYSHREFSRFAGFGSPNYLKLVMDGERTVAPKSFYAFMRGLMITGNDVELALDIFLQDRDKKIDAELESGKTIEEAA
jgi:hypothetical protein